MLFIVYLCKYGWNLGQMQVWHAFSAAHVRVGCTANITTAL